MILVSTAGARSAPHFENEYERNRNASDAAEGADVWLLVRGSILGPDGYPSVVTDTVERVTGRHARSLGALLSEPPAVAS
jgi:hypothetical protein